MLSPIRHVKFIGNTDPVVDAQFADQRLVFPERAAFAERRIEIGSTKFEHLESNLLVAKYPLGFSASFAPDSQASSNNASH
jgi:hypothetical protein